MPKEKQRLDAALVERGLIDTRQKAKAVIMSGVVYVDGQKADKAGHFITPENAVEVRSNPLKYVSRGGLKLEKAINCFEIDPAGLTVMDVGASTGGFSDVLLQNGAAAVYAVDVGYGQLAWTIRNDPRVTVFERTNIRNMLPGDIPALADMAVIDVSFISLKLVLPPVYNLTKPGARVVCLVKPQFEAGREKVGKKGVVRDPETHKQVLYDFLQNAQNAKFGVLDITYSPITGPEGNIEFIGLIEKDEDNAVENSARPTIDIDKLVEQAHAEMTS